MSDRNTRIGEPGWTEEGGRLQTDSCCPRYHVADSSLGQPMNRNKRSQGLDMPETCIPWVARRAASMCGRWVPSMYAMEKSRLACVPKFVVRYLCNPRVWRLGRLVYYVGGGGSRWQTVASMSVSSHLDSVVFFFLLLSSSWSSGRRNAAAATPGRETAWAWVCGF